MSWAFADAMPPKVSAVLMPASNPARRVKGRDGPVIESSARLLIDLLDWFA
jgi:hypothetical protein